VTDYLPDFHPKNPFKTPITLRELMSHRSGLLREPPVGNYFETSDPTIAATVESLNDTELVYAPRQPPSIRMRRLPWSDICYRKKRTNPLQNI